MSDSDGALTEIMEMIVALASNDFTRRTKIGDGSTLLDAVGTGLNMLAEEFGLHYERDRKTQKRIAQAERLASIGQLAAGVAHEVNNPATFLLANATELSENCPPSCKHSCNSNNAFCRRHQSWRTS